MSQWVQHISGQGKKWELEPLQKPNGLFWMCCPRGEQIYPFLPKSEYHICAPPEEWEEEWEDVTRAIMYSDPFNCQVSDAGAIEYLKGVGHKVEHVGRIIKPFRLRKLLCCDADGLGCECGQGKWAFIVERRKS